MWLLAGYRVSKWVFLADESSSAAAGWGILAIELQAAPETLDFPVATDTGGILSLQ